MKRYRTTKGINLGDLNGELAAVMVAMRNHGVLSKPNIRNCALAKGTVIALPVCNITRGLEALGLIEAAPEDTRPVERFRATSRVCFGKGKTYRVISGTHDTVGATGWAGPGAVVEVCAEDFQKLISSGALVPVER